MFAYVTDYVGDIRGAPISISSYTGNFDVDSYNAKKDEKIIACVDNKFGYTDLSATIGIVGPHHPCKGL